MEKYKATQASTFSLLGFGLQFVLENNAVKILGQEPIKEACRMNGRASFCQAFYQSTASLDRMA
jgi:hypothetical protein